MEEQPKSPPSLPNNQGFIAIPCPPERLGEFISGLLGKPQTTQRSIYGSLRFTIEDIKNLHHLISQRILEQNVSYLVQFVGTVYYSDGSSIEVPSYSDFLGYAEVRPIESIGFNLTWVFLITFPLGNAPERQQVEVGAKLRSANWDHRFARALPPFVDSFGQSTGYVQTRVVHTRRSWGEDIDNLLNAHLSNSVGAPARARKLLSKHQVTTWLTLFLLTLSAELRLGWYLLVRQSKSVEALFALDSAPGTLVGIGHSVQAVAVALYGHRAMIEGLQITLYFAVATASAITVASILVALVDTPEPSFILLTRKSLEAEVESRRRYSSNWRNFILGSLVTVALGIASNIIFSIFP